MMIEQKKHQVDLAGKRPLQSGAEDGQGDQERGQVHVGPGGLHHHHHHHHHHA